MPPLIRVRHRFPALAILALALLLAQVGALAHGYTHLRAQGDLVGPGTAAGQICTECLSFTPLLSAVSASDASVISHPPCASEAPQSQATAPAQLRAVYAFRSRAPPALV